MSISFVFCTAEGGDCSTCKKRGVDQKDCNGLPMGISKIEPEEYTYNLNLGFICDL